ncbi:ATP-binding cassette domain-containing protein, partial [Lactobacillus acetotolerans]|uniref:ATP-binding cassette domain-containing protein n=1 Tax=Lactobacillus acetotolerans TaxID=1600 RepID=UPI00247FF0D4
KALENSGLLSFKDQYPDQLSGGMQQRVGIARALANDPEILLMDEAFSALDPLIRREMQDELISLQNTVKKTIIFITHDLNEALRIGDRIAIMKDGEIVQIGTGEEILTHPANEYVRDFVEEVDRSKVLTAANIMVPAIMVNIDNDGPSAILNRMNRKDVDLLLAVNREGKLLGYLNAEDVLETKRTGNKAESAVNSNVTRVDKDTLVVDLFEVGNQSPAPIVVVDGERLLGVIPHGRIIDALAKTSEVKK